MFSVDMSQQEMAAALEARFGYLRTASDREVAALEQSLRELRAPGQPINQRNLQIFRYADEERERGATNDDAIRHALEQYQSQHERRHHTADDNEDDIETLIRLYRRYRKKVACGLEPDIANSRELFFSYVLHRQWESASAIFVNVSTERRQTLCDALNRNITSYIQE